MSAQPDFIPLTEKEKADAQWALDYHRRKLAEKNAEDYARRQRELEKLKGGQGDE
jgi:hypothetical protein